MAKPRNLRAIVDNRISIAIMSSSPSRAQFLRGDFSGKSRPQRPPWSVEEARFVELCGRSGTCIQRCPEKILIKGRGGFPQVDFSLGGCSFCGECVKACPSGALQRSDEATPWQLKASVEPDCLAYGQVVCRTCGEYCQLGAIRFPPLVGGVAKPQVDAASCNGCGACVAPCPRQAIKLRELD